MIKMDQVEMIRLFADMVEKYFRVQDRKFVEEVLEDCDIYIKDGVYIAAEWLSKTTLYVYFIITEEDKRGRGLATKVLSEFLEERQPMSIGVTTAHPAIEKIFNNLKGYRSVTDPESPVVQRMASRIYRGIPYRPRLLKAARGRIVWRYFYGDRFPQRYRDFEPPAYLKPGDALLAVKVVLLGPQAQLNFLGFCFLSGH